METLLNHQHEDDSNPCPDCQPPVGPPPPPKRFSLDYLASLPSLPDCVFYEVEDGTV